MQRVPISIDAFMALTAAMPQPVTSKTVISADKLHSEVSMTIEQQPGAPSMVACYRTLKSGGVSASYFIETDAGNSRSDADDNFRSDQEIVDQTEALAKLLLESAHNVAAAEGNIRDSDNPRAIWAWAMAVKAQEMLTSTDVENAVSALEGMEHGQQSKR